MILFLKELWVLRFWLLFLCALHLLFVLIVLWTDFIDLQILTIAKHQSDVWNSIIYNIIIGLGAAATALGHEREHETQRFLDGLPVSRSRVYFTKCLAALLVSLISAVTIVLLDFSIGLFSMKSNSAPLPWLYAAEFTLLASAHLFSVTGVGMALSFSRRWFLALAGLLIWLSIWLRLQEGWQSSLLDSVELLTPTIEAGRVQKISLIALTGHLGIGLIGFLIGWWFYVMRQGSLSLFFSSCWQRRGFRWLAKLAPVLAIVVWVMAVKDFNFQDEEGNDEPPVTVAAGQMPKDSKGAEQVVQFERRESKLCEFIFKSTQKKLAEPLIAAADNTCHEALAAFSKKGQWPGKLVVDLASELPSHAAARAHWTKISFPLRQEMPLEEQLNILRHEVTHVIIEQISDGQASAHFESMRAFHEGMATYVETSAANPSAKQQREHYEVEAALAWSRGAVTLSDLLDADQLKEQRDEYLVYPLGLIFIQALIDIGGSEMPLRVMQTLNANRPPPGVKGKDLWLHLLSHTGHSMAQLDGAYELRLADLVKRHQKIIDSLPVLTGEVSREGENIVIRPAKVSPPDGWQIVCVIESSFGIVKKRQNFQLNPDGSFHLPPASVREGRVRYMLGWAHPVDRYHILEPWQESNLPNPPPAKSQ